MGARFGSLREAREAFSNLFSSSLAYVQEKGGKKLHFLEFSAYFSIGKML